MFSLFYSCSESVVSSKHPWACYVNNCQSLVLLDIWKRYDRAILDRSMTVVQKHKQKKKYKKMKAKIFTILIISLLESVAYIPRVIYLLSVRHKRIDIEALGILNLIFFINPLFDPAIYLLRFEAMRKEFRFCCRRETSVHPITGIGLSTFGNTLLTHVKDIDTDSNFSPRIKWHESQVWIPKQTLLLGNLIKQIINFRLHNKNV